MKTIQVYSQNKLVHSITVPHYRVAEFQAELQTAGYSVVAG